MTKNIETKTDFPKKEDWNLPGLKDREKLFCINPFNGEYGPLNDHDKLIFEGYRFIGIKREDGDAIAKKVGEYKEQNREIASLPISRLIRCGHSGNSEQLIPGVEAYFVR